MLSELINFGRQFTFRETLRDHKPHNWIFPQRIADVFVSILLQAVIPTWKASANCLLLSLTAKDREPSTSMSWPHAPGKCIHPQPTPWCQLHSLDLITMLNPTLLLWASEQNKHVKCTCRVRKEVANFFSFLFLTDNFSYRNNHFMYVHRGMLSCSSTMYTVLFPSVSRE